jgi:AcrR family transcriptional regulator
VAGGEELSGRREERRRHILEVAREAFSNQGYNEVTVALITDRAGIAKGTFYLYFASKEDLFLEVIRDAVNRLRRTVADAVSGVDNPLEKIRVSVPVIFDICRREAGLYLVIFQQASFLESERYEEYNALYDPIAGDFQATIEEGMRSGVFTVGDPQIISHGVFGFLASLIHQWLLLESGGGAPDGHMHKMSETVSRFFNYGLVGGSFPLPGELSDDQRRLCRLQLLEVQRLMGELAAVEKALKHCT